jgi:hypothetical protein
VSPTEGGWTFAGYSRFEKVISGGLQVGTVEIALPDRDASVRVKTTVIDTHRPNRGWRG